MGASKAEHGREAFTVAVQASENGTQPRVAQVTDTPERRDRETQESRILSWGEGGNCCAKSYLYTN